MVDRIGVVLAGGRSSRFSGEKAFALLKGQCFFEHLLNSFTSSVDEIVIVSRPELTERFREAHPDVRIIEDMPEYAGKGPLAGLYTVMKQAPAIEYIVIAVDMPFVTGEAVQQLLQLHDRSKQALIPVVNERMQPMFAVYRYNCLSILEQQLASTCYRLIDFIHRLNTQFLTEEELEIHEQCFININDDASYEKWIGEQNARKED